MKAVWLWFFPSDLSLRAAWRIWQRNATVYSHTYRYNLVPNFFEPFFYLLSLGFGLAMHIKQMEGLPYVPFIASGLLASQAMMGASFEVTYNVYVRMVYAKTYDAILCTPIQVEEIALGEILWATTRAVIYTSIFLVVIACFGLLLSPWALLVPVAAIWVGAAFAGIGLTFTALVPNIDMYNFYFTLFLTPLFLFSGIFYALSDLPSWMQTVAWFTPLYHGVEVMRSLVVKGLSWKILAHLGCLTVMAVFFCGLSVRMFRRRLVK